MARDWEGRDIQGYIWIADPRIDNYFYLKDFEHIVVMQIGEQAEGGLQQHWEAIIFEDEHCRAVRGRKVFATQQEAKLFLEQYVEVSLKNHP